MGKKILVVDDEVDVVKVLKRRLEDQKFEVITAFDGDEGLEKTKTEKPDLIILDIMMPMIDGYTFVRELKANQDTAHIPVIVLTAKGNGLKELFQVEGIRDYVTKPYEIDQLMAKVSAYL